jgi:hypothetical protein
MKKAILILVLICNVSNLFSQKIQKDKAFYLNRSESQKVVAFGLLIAGGACVVRGYFTGDQKEEGLNEGLARSAFRTVGVLAIIGSIPLFVASAKNKKKAVLMVSTNTLPPTMLTRAGKKVISIGIAIPL